MRTRTRRAADFKWRFIVTAIVAGADVKARRFSDLEIVFNGFPYKNNFEII